MTKCASQLVDDPLHGVVDCASVCPPIKERNSYCSLNCNEYEDCMAAETPTVDRPPATKQPSVRVSEHQQDCIPDESFPDPTHGRVVCKDVCLLVEPIKKLYCNTNCPGYMKCKQTTQEAKPITQIPTTDALTSASTSNGLFDGVRMVGETTTTSGFVGQAYVLTLTAGLIAGTIVVLVLLLLIAFLLGCAAHAVWISTSRRSKSRRSKKESMEERIRLNTSSSESGYTTYRLPVTEENSRSSTSMTSSNGTIEIPETKQDFPPVDAADMFPNNLMTPNQLIISEDCSLFPSSVINYENSYDFRSDDEIVAVSRVNGVT